MSGRRVVVTGIGLVTPLGADVSSSWSRLINSDCAIKNINVEQMLQQNTHNIKDPNVLREAFKNLPTNIAAQVPRSNYEDNNNNG